MSVLQQMFNALLELLAKQEQLTAALAAKDEALTELIQHTRQCEKQLDEFHGMGADAGSGCSIEVCNATKALTLQPHAALVAKIKADAIDGFLAEKQVIYGTVLLKDKSEKGEV